MLLKNVNTCSTTETLLSQMLQIYGYSCSTNWRSKIALSFPYFKSCIAKDMDLSYLKIPTTTMINFIRSLLHSPIEFSLSLRRAEIQISELSNWKTEKAYHGVLFCSLIGSWHLRSIFMPVLICGWNPDKWPLLDHIALSLLNCWCYINFIHLFSDDDDFEFFCDETIKEMSMGIHKGANTVRKNSGRRVSKAKELLKNLGHQV